MSNETVRGEVIETLPNTFFKVRLESEREIVCYLAGKMKMNHIKVLIGDRVAVVLDPYNGKTTNRIVERLKEPK